MYGKKKEYLKFWDARKEDRVLDEGLQGTKTVKGDRDLEVLEVPNLGSRNRNGIWLGT